MGLFDPETWRSAGGLLSNNVYGQTGGLLGSFLPPLPKIQQIPYMPGGPGGGMAPMPFNFGGADAGGNTGGGVGGGPGGVNTSDYYMPNEGANLNPDYNGPTYMGGNKDAQGNPIPGYGNWKDWWAAMGTGPGGLLGSVGGASPWAALAKSVGGLFNTKPLDTGNLITQFDGQGRPIGGGQGLGMGNQGQTASDEYMAALEAAQGRPVNFGASPGHLGSILADLGMVQQRPIDNAPALTLQRPTLAALKAAGAMPNPFGGGGTLADLLATSPNALVPQVDVGSLWGGGSYDPNQDVAGWYSQGGNDSSLYDGESTAVDDQGNTWSYDNGSGEWQLA